MKRAPSYKAWLGFHPQSGNKAQPSTKAQPSFEAQQRLLRRLPDPARILRGSLFKRTIRHRHGCRVCRRGRGHMVWVVAVSYKGGRTRQFSIRAEQKKWVEKLLANYRKLKSGLEAICEMNLSLLRSRKRSSTRRELTRVS